MKKLISRSVFKELLKLEFGGIDNTPCILHHVIVEEGEKIRAVFFSIRWWIVGNYKIYIEINSANRSYDKVILESITSTIMRFGKYPTNVNIEISLKVNEKVQII